MSNRVQLVRPAAAVLLAFGLILGLLPVFAASDPIEIHVAPTGDDTADGSRANPVASLIGARDAVRQLRADGNTGPVRVVVADGTYRFAEPLVLMPEDGGTTEAPVRYEAAPGAKPVFSGGRLITGFRPVEDGLWVAKVPEVATGTWYFEQLFVNGRRAVRALHFHVTNLAANHFEGLVIPPYNRENASQQNTYRPGSGYIAIRPLKAYTIDTNDPKAGEFDVVRSASSQTGFVFIY